MGESEATPIEMLYQRFNDDALPAPRQLTHADIDGRGNPKTRHK